MSVTVAGSVTFTTGGGTGVTDGDKGDIVVSSSGTAWQFAPAVVTAAGRAILDDASAAAQRTTLGLGTIATAAAGDYVLTSSFAEGGDERVAALLVAGANITLTYDDGANTLTIAASGGGGGGSGTRGTASLNFGSFPGGTHATVAVTGQAGILATSTVRAWIAPAATAAHSADEHVIAASQIAISVASVVAGVGFTIHGAVAQVPAPLTWPGINRPHRANGTVGQNVMFSGGFPSVAATDPGRHYGTYNIAWEWV